MKTKLLCLLLLSCFGTFAQIQAPGLGSLTALNITQNSARIQFNVNYNGSPTNCSATISLNSNMSSPQQTGNIFVNVFGWQTRYFDLAPLQPNTTYYWRVTASNGLGTIQSQIVSFTTLAPPTAPTISNISTTDINHISSKVNYTISPNHGNTTSIIKYGLASNTLTSQVNGLSANDNTPVSGAVTLGSLSPSTTYFYQIEATNSAGTTSSNIESFTTIAPPTPQIIAEYNFNNTYNNVNGNTPFLSNDGTSFIADRNGNANSAINLNNWGTMTQIPNLPYGNDSRTVSLWAKLNTIGAQWNFLYSYGTAANPEGAYINATTATHFAPGNQVSSAHSINTWYHYVFTFDGTSSKIYRNGTLLNSSNVTKNTVNNSNSFRLGQSEGGAINYFNGAIDDLQIYNYALSDAEVTLLYTNNTLTTENFTVENKIKLYPNPVNDILNIDASAAIQSIEIFNIQGQKVLSSNEKQINVSHLASGVYLVKVQDSYNKVSTNKIIIK